MSIDGNINLGDLTGQGARTPFLLAGSVEPALSLPSFALSADGAAGMLYEADDWAMTLPGFDLPDAGMADGMQLPAFGVQAQGQTGTAITGRLSLPVPTLSGSLEPPLALLPPQLDATGGAGALLAAPLLQLELLQLQAESLDATGMTLEAFVAAGDLLAGTTAIAAPSLAGWGLAGVAFQSTSGDGQITLALLQLDASGTSTSVVGGSITLDLLQVSAAAVSGTIASAALTVPLFDTRVDAFAEAIGSATIVLPVFETLGALAVVVPRPFLTTVVLNTRLKGVSRYEGLAANSFAMFAGLQLAATPNGIVALMGETDLGNPIAASITGGTSDLGAPERKRVDSAYVGYRSGNDMEITLITDEHQQYTYRLVPRQVADAIHGTRVKFGRGVDGRYWQWRLANTAGAGFDLASLQLNVVPLSRVV